MDTYGKNYTERGWTKQCVSAKDAERGWKDKMAKPVLFVTGLGKELDRAENIKTLYDAYPGEKKFISMHYGYYQAIDGGDHDLMVVDIFPDRSPGKCIMMWHAIQGGKLIGLGQKNGTYYREEWEHFMDRIVVAGKGGIEMFHQCTGVPKERIVNLGMPRTDKYIGKKKGDGNTFLKGFERAYLFVPTFRGLDETPFPCIDWKWLDDQLESDEVIAVKPHPYGHPMDMNGYKHIMALPKMESTARYLMDADVVITDYSSTMFDGWLLNKPVVLFEKNPGYTETRGMYLPYPDGYSPRYARNEEELLNLIRKARRMTKVEKECRDYVADMCDGHSCERIIKLIERMNGE